jgi:hypothetical protein
MRSLLLAGTILGALALPTNAQTILTPADENLTGTGTFNGVVNGNVVPGLTSTITYTLLDVNVMSNTWTFGFALDNTTASPLASEVSAFGFRTTPDLEGATISGTTFTTALIDVNAPGGIGNVDFCASTGPTCGGGASGGVAPGDGIVSGQFTLDVEGPTTTLALSDFFVRYQAINGAGFNDASGVGFPGPGGVPFGVTPVPGPAIGAGIPGLLAAFAGFVGWRRLRRA